MQQLNNISEVLKVLAPLNLAYSKELDNERMKLYAEMLRNIPLDVLKGAIVLEIQENPFLPTVAEIRKRALKVHQKVQEEVPMHAMEAFEEVMRAIRLYGHARGLEKLDPFLQKIAKRLGWRSLCYGDEKTLSVLRAQFINAYNAEKERQQEEVRIQHLIQGSDSLREKQTKAIEAKRLLGLEGWTHEGMASKKARERN